MRRSRMAGMRGLARSLLWGLSLCLSTPDFASAQSVRLDAIPTGLGPVGLAVRGLSSPIITPTGTERAFVFVANSRDDSVSIFSLKGDPAGTILATMQLKKTVRGIPAPYAVSVCGLETVLVTSPLDNSVTLVQVPDGQVLGRVRVGPLPYSAVCYGNFRGVVSNAGDNTLSIISLDSFAVTATVPGVPGSRGWQGISLQGDQNRPVVWVAGTNADVITVVDLVNFRVLFQIPVRAPSAIRDTWVASQADNSLIRFNPQTLQLDTIIRDVPNPQDFAVFSGLGHFATIGGRDSVWRQAGSRIEIISGIPGAAALGTFAPAASQAERDLVLVTSSDSNSVFLIQIEPGLPHQFNVFNGASFRGLAIATGSLGTTFVSTGVNQNFFAGSLPLPRTLGGVTLRMGGSLNFSATSGWTYNSTGSIEAPLLFVGSNQINFQIPPGISPGDSVPAQLTKPDGSTLLTTLRITATAPGIFTVLQNGQGQAAVLNQNNSQNFGTNPARRGSVIQIYATGAGETDSPLLPGEAAPASGNPLILTRAQPTVTIGGQAARVLFSGMAPGYVGLWQINAEVPPNVPPGPAVPLVINAGGVSSNTVTIAVE